MITILIPVYNEEDEIVNTITKIKSITKKLKQKTEIIAVNDCSKDSSGEKLATISGIRFLEHKVNRGYGASLKTGINNAKGDKILIIDADGTYPIEDIPKLIALSDKYDMVVGSRTGAKVHIPLLRQPIKLFLNNFSSYIAGTKIPDLNSGLRIFKKELAYEFWHMLPERFSFTSTITIGALTNNYSVKYIKINYYKRKGKSHIRPIHDVIGFNKLLLKLALFFKPLRFFIPLGIIVLVLAAVIFFWSIANNMVIPDITIMLLTIFSFQIFFMGLIAELVVRTRK